MGTSSVDYLFLGQFGVITDENELVFMNDRFYAPYLGRFLNEDPYSLRYNDITNLNLYGYCGNDPINNVDPSGNFLETLFDIVNLAFSAKDFFSDPTVAKFATLAWDTAAAALPFIPGSYVAKGALLVDDAYDLARSGSKTALALYDVKFAAKQMLTEGKINLTELESMVPNGVVNGFKPSATIADGYKYNYTINGSKIEIKWHAPDANAAAKFPGGNSGKGWTAQIKVDGKLLGLDGNFYKNPSNLTHIPVMGVGK